MKTASSNGSLTLTLSRGEARLLSNALNEALHGLSIPDFEVRLGFSRADALVILDHLIETFEEVWPSI